MADNNLNYTSSFSGKSLSSLLDFTPAITNLYEVSIIGSTDDSDFNSYAKLHATEITFNGERITFERNPVNKAFYLGSGVTSAPYTRTDEVVITWREDSNWTVRKYHEKWIEAFYDKKTDTFQSQENASSLYRTFVITFPGKNYVHKLKLTNVLPTNMGDFHLQWTDAPSTTTHSITYKVEDFSFSEEHAGGGSSGAAHPYQEIY